MKAKWIPACTQSRSVYDARTTEPLLERPPTCWCTPQPLVGRRTLSSAIMRVPTYLVVERDGQGLFGARVRSGHGQEVH